MFVVQSIANEVVLDAASQSYVATTTALSTTVGERAIRRRRVICGATASFAGQAVLLDGISTIQVFVQPKS